MSGYHRRPGGGGGSGEPLGEIVRKNHYRQVFSKKNIHKKFTGKCKILGLFFCRTVTFLVNEEDEEDGDVEEDPDDEEYEEEEEEEEEKPGRTYFLLRGRGGGAGEEEEEDVEYDDEEDIGNLVRYFFITFLVSKAFFATRLNSQALKKIRSVCAENRF